MPDHGQIAQTMEGLRALHFTSSRDDDMTSHLDRLFQRDPEGISIPEPVRFGQTGETRGILTVAGPGSGKTHAVGRSLKKHPALQPRPDGSLPWISVTVPSPATLKSVLLALLEASGYRIEKSRRTVWELADLFRNRLSDFGFCAVWIDEAHDLFCKEGESILRFFKSLMQGERAVVVILSGTDLLDDLIRSDPQVQRRFSVIRPPVLTVSVDGPTFPDLIQLCCDRAGLRQPDDPQLTPRLFHAARYKFGRAIEMTLNAIEQALLEGADALEIWHFALVWGMQEGPTEGRNVFLVEDWVRIETDPEPRVPQTKRHRSKTPKGGR